MKPFALADFFAADPIDLVRGFGGILRFLREHFGRSAPFAVLLLGPAPAVDRQGPQLVRALRAADPRITTLSPWDRGSVGRLRPSPRRPRRSA